MKKSPRLFSFRHVRIFVLVAVLLVAGAATYWEQNSVRSWKHPIQVEIYPINGDGTERVAAYIATLTPAHFEEIGSFIQEQAERYWIKLSPAMVLRLGHEIAVMPPAPPPSMQDRLAVVLWSLRLRYWVYQNASGYVPELAKIRIFVIYHESRPNQALDHSLGLRKGLIGVVHAYASEAQAEQNNVVIAHELLHTLGPTDKYDAAGLPIFPEGFGDSEQVNRYPQQYAEIMAGRVALAPEHAEMPSGLGACVVGYKTANEINWTGAFRDGRH